MAGGLARRQLIARNGSSNDNSAQQLALSGFDNLVIAAQREDIATEGSDDQSFQAENGQVSILAGLRWAVTGTKKGYRLDIQPVIVRTVRDSIPKKPW